MALLLTTRGLGKRGGFLTTKGLGRGVFAKGPVGTSDKFHDMVRLQIEREDEELLVICQGLIKIICR